jgi:MFS family permease
MPRLPRPVAFWLVAVTTATVLLSSAAPSPLYPVYQQVFGFSAFTLTVVFAVYVIALVGTLLTVGSISDHIGRRPVLAASIVLLIVAMVVFVEADGTGMLLTARILQGLATGALTGTASAALVDLAPTPHVGSMITTATPPLGLATGSVLAGVLVQYAPLPRELVYIVVGTALAVMLVAVAFLPETSPLHGFDSRRHLATTLAPSMSVPGEVRSTFLAAAPAMAATWALGGLYLSLGSSIAAKVLGVMNHAAAGAILCSFFGSAATAAALGTRLPSRVAIALGYGALGAGVLVTMAATLLSSAPLYVAGSVLAGIGFGTTLLGVMTTMATATSPSDRGRVFAAVFALSYTAFSVPAVVAGLLATHVGLTPTAVGYALFIVGLVVIAAAAAVLTGRRAGADETAEDVEADLAECAA